MEARWFVAGAAGVALVGGCALVDRITGVEGEGARLEGRLAEARRWGFDPEMARRRALEAARPEARRKAWEAYVADAVALAGNPAPAARAVRPRTETWAEFRRNLPAREAAFERASRLARAADGGVTRHWERGFAMTSPDLTGTRAWARSGERLVALDLGRGDPNAAVDRLGRLLDLYRPTAEDPTIASHVLSTGGAFHLLRGAERILLESPPSSEQTRRLLAFARDPVFAARVSDRALFLRHAAATFSAIGDPAEIERIRKADLDPRHARVYEVADDPAVRRAWQSDALRVFDAFAPRFSDRLVPFETRAAVWRAYAEEMTRPNGLVGAMRAIMAESGLYFPERGWIDWLVTRESIRRVVELAVRLGSGEPEADARRAMGERAIDPGDGRPLRVRRSGTSWPLRLNVAQTSGDPPPRHPDSPPIVVYAVGGDRSDDGGTTDIAFFLARG